MSHMRINLPYVMVDRDQGIERVFVRRHGRKIRLRETPGTEAFALEYTNALEAIGRPPGAKGLTPAAVGTLGWLASLYFASSEFRALAAQTQITRRQLIEHCLREPPHPGSSRVIRDMPLSAVNAAVVKMLRDRKADQPAAANNRRKFISAMFGWAVEQGKMTSNPAREVRKVKYATDGWHTWTIDEVAQFEAKHPIGTKARLALALLLFLGVRRGDVVKLGRQMVKDGWLTMIPRKTRYKRLRKSEKPVLPILADIIARSPTGDLTFLVTEYGKPFSAAGFGGWFRDRCDEAGLRHCSAHGLRKAGATIAANNGATDRQLMALFDWVTAAQANTYTADVDRRKLAGEAAGMIAGDQTGNKDCPDGLPRRGESRAKSTG